MGDVAQVSQLVLRERQSRVRALSEELLACFHEDATVETSWMQGSAAAFAAGAGERSASSGAIINRVGPPVVQVSGQRGFAELPSTTTRWIEVNGTEAVLVSFMRLLYRVERRNGPWKISAMSAINEGDTLEPAVPGTDLRVDRGGLAGLRPSYRFLAHTRSLDGITVSQDLLGIDRPGEVDAIYAAAAAWTGRAEVTASFPASEMSTHTPAGARRRDRNPRPSMRVSWCERRVRSHPRAEAISFCRRVPPATSSRSRIPMSGSDKPVAAVTSSITAARTSSCARFHANHKLLSGLSRAS